MKVQCKVEAKKGAVTQKRKVINDDKDEDTKADRMLKLVSQDQYAKKKTLQKFKQHFGVVDFILKEECYFHRKFNKD